MPSGAASGGYTGLQSHMGRDGQQSPGGPHLSLHALLTAVTPQLCPWVGFGIASHLGVFL